MAFVLDMCSRDLMGSRVLKSLQTDGVLDALEQPRWAQGKPEGVTHPRDRGSQSQSIRYAERLTNAGLEAAVRASAILTTENQERTL